MAVSGPVPRERARRNQGDGFAGRLAELGQFRENLALAAGDSARWRLFCVYGDGGVGKSSLLREMERIAQDAGRLCAVIGDDDHDHDDQVRDVPGAMRSIARQLQPQAARLKRFGKRDEAYRRQNREQGGPDGMRGAFTSTAIRESVEVATRLGKDGTFGEVIQEFSGALDPVATGAAAGRVGQTALGRMSRRGEVTIADLTEAFIADLADLGRPVTLFFDTYERTGEFLDGWLRRLIGGRPLALPKTVDIVVAGRYPLDGNAWSADLESIRPFQLEPFTEAEARQVIAAYGVTDERVAEIILRNSGGLPLAVAMLASVAPADHSGIGDVTESVVDRFLRWEPDRARREAILAAALPRRVNEDTLAILLDGAFPGVAAGSETEFYQYLAAQPFTSSPAYGIEFHDIVRGWMLRSLWRRSADRWRQSHARLAVEFGKRRDALGRDPADLLENWADRAWRETELERLYHLLCADPQRWLGDALAAGVAAGAYQIADARQWTEMLRSAAMDLDRAESPAARPADLEESPVVGLTERLQDALNAPRPAAERMADEAAPAPDLAAFIDVLLRAPDLPDSVRGEAYRVLGREHRNADRLPKALAAFAESIRRVPGNALAYAGRGETYRLLGRDKEALADLDRAIETGPADTWTLSGRGLVHEAMGHYKAALADYTHVLAIDPGSDWERARQGQCHRLLGEYREALECYNEAIEALDRRDLPADPDLGRIWADRADTHRLLSQYKQAVADATRALDIDPGDIEVLTIRGDAYRRTGRLMEALADLDRAIEIDPRYTGALVSRGKVYRARGEDEAAHTDFDLALAIDPERARIWMDED
jgi:tetratricopeptide (TPR) repeat protein